MRDDQLVRYVRSNHVVRILVLGGTGATTAVELLTFADSAESVSLIADAVRNVGSIGDRSDAIRGSIAQTSGNSFRVGAALLSVAGVAATLRSTDAEMILRTCLAQARIGSGPYQIQGNGPRYRGAAVAIIETHPELDYVAIGFATDPNDRTTWELYAAALRRRPADRWEAAITFLEAVHPPPRTLRAFAESADARPSIETIGGLPRGRFLLIRSITDDLLRILSAVFGVLSATLVFVLAMSGNWQSLGLRLDLTAVFAVLAVLVAAHVVAAELAADRLPGPLARYTSLPNSLIAGYGAVAAMALIAALEGDHPWSAWGWAVATAALGFGCVLLWSMGQLIRRTDSAYVVEVFERHQEAASQRAGWHLGTLQRRASITNEALQNQTIIRLRTSPAIVERRIAIPSKRRGFFFVRLRAIQRLARVRKWADGSLRLHVKGGFGTIVNEGEEVMAVVPTYAAVASRIDAWRAARSIEIRSVGGIEETAQWVSVCVQEAAQLARRGDVGGSQRAARAAHRLLQTHVRAVHTAAQWSRATPVAAPVIPALRDSLQGAVERLAGAVTNMESEALCTFIESALDDTIPVDAATVMLASAVRKFQDTLDPVVASRVMKRAAIRCVESDNRIGAVEALTQMRRLLLARPGEPLRVVATDLAEVAASACWLNYGIASEIWTRVWSIATAVQGTQVRPIREEVGVIVGSAALAAGTISIAVDVVERLRSAGSAVAAIVRSYSTGAAPASLGLMSDIGSGFLGESPTEAVGAFCGFASRMDPLL